MKLNPEKCTFALGAGKFLGFIVSQGGIKVSPEKIKAIMDMQPPKTIKHMGKCQEAFSMLALFRCPQRSHWLLGYNMDGKMSRSFCRLEAILVLTAATYYRRTNGPLSFYLAASDKTIGTVLIKENENTQKPVYFVSHVLKDAETR